MPVRAGTPIRPGTPVLERLGKSAVIHHHNEDRTGWCIATAASLLIIQSSR